jgi:hypothetical protein
MKKYRALELVSEAIGQSADTIRDWEKGAKFDEDYSNELQCAELEPDPKASGAWY